MTEHLGGPESEERLLERQRRYEIEVPNQFKIVEQGSGRGVGWVGFWQRDWNAASIYEIGWAVIPEFQGRGIAKKATRSALALARAEGARRYVHAFPAVDNSPSNALCEGLGFTLQGTFDFEYLGKAMICNDWQFDLHSSDA
jgi:RimJ/RimL family protein N-acetyltransferase